MKQKENKWFPGPDVGPRETQSKCCSTSGFGAIWRLSQKKVASGKDPLTQAGTRRGDHTEPSPEHTAGFTGPSTKQPLRS